MITKWVLKKLIKKYKHDLEIILSQKEGHRWPIEYYDTLIKLDVLERILVEQDG
jgi:hypothetical protein